MNRHTPGPWVANEQFAEVWAGHELIASCHESDAPDARHTAKANAHLIAAAPDLLEAAKTTVLHFKRMQASGNYQGDDEHGAWSALSKAIAKAEGK